MECTLLLLLCCCYCWRCRVFPKCPKSYIIYIYIYIYIVKHPDIAENHETPPSNLLTRSCSNQSRKRPEPSQINPATGWSRLNVSRSIVLLLITTKGFRCEKRTTVPRHKLIFKTAARSCLFRLNVCCAVSRFAESNIMLAFCVVAASLTSTGVNGRSVCPTHATFLWIDVLLQGASR